VTLPGFGVKRNEPSNPEEMRDWQWNQEPICFALGSSHRGNAALKEANRDEPGRHHDETLGPRQRED
jgi:hypothetical protein